MENNTTPGNGNNNFVYHSADFWESAQTSELDAALVKFNSKFKAVKRDETVTVPGRAARKFASLDEIMIEVRPILADNGLYVQQPITGDKITTIVRHASGQFRAFSMPMVAWQGQGTTAIQNLGGAITYMRRYSLGAALALATEEDDDGQSTGKLDLKKSRQESAAPAPAPAPAKPQPPALEESVIDAWQSKVNDCKAPKDFTRLSKELKDLNLEKGNPLRAFIAAAMGTQMEKVGVEFADGIYSKKLPTEKQA